MEFSCLFSSASIVIWTHHSLTAPFTVVCTFQDYFDLFWLHNSYHQGLFSFFQKKSHKRCIFWDFSFLKISTHCLYTWIITCWYDILGFPFLSRWSLQILPHDFQRLDVATEGVRPAWFFFPVGVDFLPFSWCLNNSGFILSV